MIDINQLAEDNEKIVVGGGGGSYNPHTYSKLILEKNIPEHITPLTDWKRMLPLALHWNADAKTMDICDKAQGKSECAKCKLSGKKDSGISTSKVRLGFAFDHDKIGVMRESKQGEMYEADPIVIVEYRAGENEENFKSILDENGDPDKYYRIAEKGEKVFIDKGKQGKYTLDVEKLLTNEFLFSETGDDQIWQVKKSVAKGKGDREKTSYPPLKKISQRKAQENLGKETKLIVSAHVRKHFDLQSLHDLAPHYLAHYGNVDWEAFGLEKPSEDNNARIYNKPREVKEGETKQKVASPL